MLLLTESTLSFHGLSHQVFYLVENSLLGLFATSAGGVSDTHSQLIVLIIPVCVDGK